MNVSGSHTFAARREEVWEALLDPAVLSTILPGCEQLEQSGEGEYSGVMNLKVGPVQGKFQGKVQIEDPRPPESYSLKLDGRGAPGWVRATVGIELAEEGTGAVMTYDGDAQVGGRIASVGQRLLDSSTRSIIRQSLDGLDRALAARTAAASPQETGAEAAAPPAAAAAPTQSEFAAQVAKDVARDLIPRPVLVGGLILLIVVVLYFLLN